jgi:hypothetical protein
MGARMIDDATSRLRCRDDCIDQPILPTEQRVIARYCEKGHYPNTITPRSIERAVRDRVAGGMDVFEAMRQVLGGVARWSAR